MPIACGVSPDEENNIFSTYMFVAMVKFGLASTSGVRYAVADEFPARHLITVDMV